MMFRRTISLLLAVFPVLLQAQPLTARVTMPARTAQPGSDTIYYRPGIALVWDDFRGTPPGGNGREAALTSSGFGFDAGMRFSNGKGVINIAVYAFFNKQRSWVKPGKKTVYILGHEQLHFDISCIGMLLFTERLRAAKFTVANYSAELNRIYAECYTEMNNLQNEYDGNTSNGLIQPQQLEWAKRIRSQLALLQATVK